MKKRKFPLLLILGGCLILVSLSLVLTMYIRGQQGGQNCQNVLSKLETILPEAAADLPGQGQMPALEIDGADYVAVLEVPAFGITLPVADRWNSSKLYLSPSRFSGSAYENTLVIGGADAAQQFAFCDKIGQNATVTVTDMTGNRFSYTVSGVDRAKQADAQWLAEADSDLTLFCHDVFSMEYIAVRCILTTK